MIQRGVVNVTDPIAVLISAIAESAKCSLACAASIGWAMNVLKSNIRLSGHEATTFDRPLVERYLKAEAI